MSQQEKAIELILPMSPSVNKAYAGYPRRHKSDVYKAWEVQAIIALSRCPKKYTITGDNWLGVSYEFHFPLFCKNGKKRERDVFNYEKCLSDLLCKKNVGIAGFKDHKIKVGTVTKIDSEKELIRVRIWEL